MPNKVLRLPSQPAAVRDKRPLAESIGSKLILCVALGLGTGGSSAEGGLAPGWIDQDIGSPILAGSASFTHGVWTVTGGGAGIGNAADQLNLAYTILDGDGAVMARVTSQAGTDSGAQAGVMIRSDTTAGSPEASVLITPANSLTFLCRVATNGATAQSSVTGIPMPAWVRLSRSNDTFTATYSADGVSWSGIGVSQAISMGSQALAGLAVSANDKSLANLALLTCVLVTPGPQGGVPTVLDNVLTWQTTWPLPQINTASNAPTPRMGWNSWLVVGDDTGPSESLIESTADALVDSGLAAAGYKYVVIDCTWIASGRGSRDTNGNLIVDPTRWPHGMKAVSDYVHSKGLLMGGYSDIGALGWGNPQQIGSFAYYQQDADQFAAWEWDFIKVDDHGPGDFYALAYTLANNSSQRPITLSLSTADTDAIQFAPRIANSFRVAFDISLAFGQVTWYGILNQFDTARDDWYAQAPGHWNDPDMLGTGLYGITDIEGRSHFNLLAILGAPLMIGTDVRTNADAYAPPLSDATLETLTNREVIAVDQDPLGAVGVEVAPDVYAKALGSFTSGQYAVLLLNRSSQETSMTVNWKDLGLVPDRPALVRDLWAHQDLGDFIGSYTSAGIPPHGTVMVKIKGTFDWSQPRVYEAEWGYNTLSGTAYCVPHNANFSATAYVTGVGRSPANTLQFNSVTAPSDGFYATDIYYASSEDRTAQMRVNGGPATTLTFPQTGSDTQVGFISIYVPLNAGENKLHFSNPNDPAPNFDKLVISLGAPSDLAAVGGDSQVILTWRGPSGASFNVYRGTASGGEGNTPIVSRLNDATYTDTNVANGQTYYYTVTALDPFLGHESPPSAEASAKPYMATSSTAYVNDVSSESPVAYWRFSEISGPVAHDSAGAFDGTYGGAVTLGVAGPRPTDFLGFELTNRAAQFVNDANNLNESWVTIPPLNLNTNTVTITCWIYPTGDQADYAGLFFCRNNRTTAGLNYGGGYSGNAGVLCYTWNNDSRTWGWNSGLTPPPNQWSLVALAIEPAQATLYLINTNGEQTATNGVTHPDQAFAGSGTIGTDTYNPYGRVFNGILDEMAVFDRTLSPTEIAQLYLNGFELPQVRLTIQWSGAAVIVSWPQGTLFEADDAAGPWSRVPNALSPCQVTPTGTKKFYRVWLRP
jgi:hypothetical protein